MKVRDDWLRRLAVYAALYLLLALLVVGCASAPPRAPAEVLVPVASCPVPPLPARPALPVATLSSASPPSEVARAYAASLELLAGYAQQLEALLAALQDPAKK